MSDSVFSIATIKSINLFCLFIAVFLMLFLPVKKEIWYDETISVKCSQGISHDTRAEIGQSGTVSSDQIRQLNTFGNVYHATLVDNGNSFLYNLLLHWFTLMFGNTLAMYNLFSRLCGVAALLAFFKLSRWFLGNTIFTSLAILLFVSDNDFWGMSHEIRAYALGIFFVTMAVAHCVRFINGEEKPIDLMLTGLFSVGAVLSHYLSVYVILVIVGYMVFAKKGKLFAPKNLLAMALPVALIGLYFALSFSAFGNMSNQNHKIAERLASQGFSISEVFIRSIRFTDVNFKAIFPSFKANTPIIMVSFLLVIGLFIAGYKLCTAEQRKNMIMLGVLGVSSSVFLALLSLKAHHYTALYYRYYSFCLPFATLFVAYVLMVIAQSKKLNMILRGGVVALFLLPCLLLFAKGIKPGKTDVKYNHLGIAGKVQKENISKLGVPDWDDALLTQCFLPANQKVDYIPNTESADFVFYKPQGVEKIALIRRDD